MYSGIPINFPPDSISFANLDLVNTIKTNNMKKNTILLLAISLLTFGFSQNEIEISYTQEKTVLLNGQKIDNQTDFETIKSILGEPVIYKEFPSGKVNYHYPELGLAVHSINGKLLFIGANYNWDGDKNFPETTFTGKLNIDNVHFDKSSTNSKLSEIKIVEINCIMPEICMTNPKEEKDIIVIGFKDNNLTQIGFEFH